MPATINPTPHPDLRDPDDLIRRLRDLEDTMLQLESGRGAIRLLGRPIGLGSPLDGDTVRFDAALNGWVPWSPKYLTATLVTQTANLAAGNHIEFNTKNTDSGHITLSTGVGQANGIFTLPSGTWKVDVHVAATYSAASAFFIAGLRDHPATTAVAGPASAVDRPYSAAFNDSFPGSASYILETLLGLGMKIELTAVGSLASIVGGGRTHISIVALS